MGAVSVSVLSLTENTLKLSLPSRTNEVIFDSEVHFVSEVSPIGEVRTNLTSLGCKLKLHCVATSLLQ